MNVLLVYAHPEPRSLNGALKEFAVQRLQAAGHQVQVSDLYSMGWKAAIDAGDSLDRDPEARFDASEDSRRAFASGRQSSDIAAEQDKLRWADALILQFPLWWFSMPAILKGWVDRVYAYGFAYGVGEHSDARWGDRYGEGSMVGKRAMWLGITLQPAGDQRAHRRPTVPHSSRHPALPGLRCAATVSGAPDQPYRSGPIRDTPRRTGQAPGPPLAH